MYKQLWFGIFGFLLVVGSVQSMELRSGVTGLFKTTCAIASRRVFSSEVNISDLHRRFASVIKDLGDQRVRDRLLQTVATQGTPEEVATLIGIGTDPNGRSAHGKYTPLHKAAIFNKCNVVAALVYSGADVHATVDGKTALELAKMMREDSDEHKMPITIFLSIEMDKKRK